MRASPCGVSCHAARNESRQLLSPPAQCEGMSTVCSRKSAIEPLNPYVLGAHILNDHSACTDARFAEIDLITDYQMLCAWVFHSGVLPLACVRPDDRLRGAPA